MVECEFPECTTFGTVIRFALELERGAAGVYEELAAKPELSAAADTFRSLATAHKKREQLLEHTRREKLNEMILEPIQDIDGTQYIIETNVPAGVDMTSASAMVVEIEDRSSRFYQDTSRTAKSLLAEAARILDKMGKENETFKERVGALQS